MEFGSKQKARSPFLPGLLLLGKQSIEAAHAIQATVGTNRKLNKILLLQLLIGWLDPRGFCTRIGFQNFKLRSRTNDGAVIALRLHTQHVEAQQGADIDFGGIGGGGRDRDLFVVDLFFAVVTELVSGRLVRPLIWDTS